MAQSQHLIIFLLSLSVLSTIAIDNTTTSAAQNFELFHRDLIFAKNTSFIIRFEERMRRDAARVALLTHQLSGGGEPYAEEGIGAHVGLGADLGLYEFVVRVGVGSPPTYLYLAMDSGSYLVWVQCLPCQACFRQAGPVFDPSHSSTFALIPCTHPACLSLSHVSGCHSGHCTYQMGYGDGSSTRGVLASESLIIGGTLVASVAIGCTHWSRATFSGVAGLMGLGRSSMSMDEQLRGFGDAYSYCLASPDSSASGYILFGFDMLPSGAIWIPVLDTTQRPSYFYVDLVGISVDDMMLPIPEDVFALSGSGEGGVVMDTGTPVTRLPRLAYEVLQSYYSYRTTGLPRAPTVAPFDTCFDMSSYLSPPPGPVIAFHFRSGPTLRLIQKNVVILVNELQFTYCFAFAPTNGVGIIGSIQQQGIRISVDATRGYIGFGPDFC